MPDYLIVVVSAWAIVQLPLALALGAILRRASERQQVAFNPARQWRNAA